MRRAAAGTRETTGNTINKKQRQAGMLVVAREQGLVETSAAILSNANAPTLLAGARAHEHTTGNLQATGATYPNP